MEAQKIMGVSVTTTDRVALSAAYNGTSLVLGRVDAFDGNLNEWRAAAVGRVRSAVQGGAAVFVEEMGDAVSQFAHGVLLSDPHPQEDRPLLAVALDWYFSMMNAGAIVFAPGTERCRIMDSAVDMKNDDRGRNVYHVDWTRVKGAHRAMMLCCLAAEGMQPVSEGYIEQMYAGVTGPDGRDPNPLQRLIWASHEWDVERERQQQIEQRRREVRL